eukprot:5075035-Pyramimonas_sp.AAC.1
MQDSCMMVSSDMSSPSRRASALFLRAVGFVARARHTTGLVVARWPLFGPATAGSRSIGYRSRAVPTRSPVMGALLIWHKTSQWAEESDLVLT